MADHTDALRRFTQQALTIWTIESVFYGCYAVLFGIAVSVFLRRQKLPIAASRWYLWALVALFVISTIVTIADLVSNGLEFYTAFGLGGISKSMTAKDMSNLDLKMGFITKIGYLLANILGDSILIHRCYIVWNSSWLVIIAPIVISIASNCVGFASIIMTMAIAFGGLQRDQILSLTGHADKMLFAFMSMNVINNVLLTGLIAGKIWWIINAVDKAMAQYQRNSKARKRYKPTVALVLESGVLYPISVLIFEILSRSGSSIPSLYQVMTQLAGIAPTLIIVRVGLGVSVNSVNDSVASLRSTSDSGSRTRFATINITDNGENGLMASSKETF
ncbi:hypothetical protein K435DRAFT_862545 [Dendrothele bispora CBS 962.96]|uniref:Fungal pheromone STE3G-protein-coupled receptor n=1 Tax=Dendrothele bispora (strain CBS 962.96) TaxID=1314807 RepID=A0A4S8LSS1_DENBC|nr:hypothetical protein K435DRAFT_862545 [Dendrothele bispora CBS 962.96]